MHDLCIRCYTTRIGLNTIESGRAFTGLILFHFTCLVQLVLFRIFPTEPLYLFCKFHSSAPHCRSITKSTFVSQLAFHSWCISSFFNRSFYMYLDTFCFITHAHIMESQYDKLECLTNNHQPLYSLYLTIYQEEGLKKRKNWNLNHNEQEQQEKPFEQRGPSQEA